MRQTQITPRPPCSSRAGVYLSLLVTLGLALFLAPRAGAITWKGGGGDLLWSTSGNWLGGLPGSSSDVVFFTNAVAQNAASNNVIAASLTIRSLSFTHTNSYNGTQTYQNTYINDGMTLTVSNADYTNVLFVGSGLSLASASTRASISGPKGSLVVLATNGFLNVRQGGSANSLGTAVLDLSGLGNCTVRARRLLVAGDGTNGSPERDRPAGTLLLAKNNHLYLTGGSFPPGITVGYDIGNGSSISNSLILGQTNYIYADTGLGVGMGRNPSILKFGGSPNSLATFRDSAGTGRQAVWLIGDSAHLSYWGNYSAGTNDFSGGVVDAQVALLVVGRSVNGTANPSTGGNDGALILNAGTVDANTVVVSYQMNDYCARVGGSIKVDGTARLQVNNAIQLGRFMGYDPTNGVSSAVLAIGTVSAGGVVNVNGGITTTTSSKNNTNNSQLIIRNGGSLSVKGNIGPLSYFELNGAALTLNLGSATNSTTPICATTNLFTGSTNSLTIAGTALTPGQIPLIKYRTLSGAGFAALTSLNLPNQTQGFLSNNVANSTVDLIITASQSGTNAPSVPTPHLNGSPPIYADYDRVLQESAARPDGYVHVDAPAVISKLIAGNIKTYAFLVWSSKADWDDFRLEFLPAAQAAGINVWLYLTPPTENSPPATYTPFGEDYFSWLTESARLGLQYPVLKGVVIDDFNSNLGLFTPDYVRRITDAAHVYNPNFLFMVINYDLSKGWSSPTTLVSPAFMNAYGPYCGAVILPYLNWASHDDYSNAALQIAHNSGIVNGKLAQFLINFPSSKSTSAGDYAAVSRVLTNGVDFTNAPYNFTFRVSGYPSTSTSGYHQLQVLVDGSVAWSRDISAAYGVQDVTVDLQPWLTGKDTATLTVRVYEQAGVSSFFTRPSWILPGGPWTKTETGGFATYSTYYPAQYGSVPMVVMIYDWKYGGGPDNSTNYINDVNVISQAAVQAGQAVGIIQFELNKTTNSLLFPVIQQLYGQWGYQPQFSNIIRQADGSISLTGMGGGPNIGYTLKAADSPTPGDEMWTTLATNAFNASGSFSNHDSGATGRTGRFYRISVP